jgi:hypothetical protein
MKIQKNILVVLGLTSFIHSANAANTLINGSFDNFVVSNQSFYNASTTPNLGWKTTAPDNLIELWQSGFGGVTAADGANFAELNAFFNNGIYQDIVIDPLSGLIDYSFSHRARIGNDTMKVVITYLGANNVFGGGDDVVVVNQNYTTGTSAWSTKSAQNAFTSIGGGSYRFAFEAVSTGSGNNTTGNFIDNIKFGINVVPEPSVSLFGGIAALGLIVRRKR